MRLKKLYDRFVSAIKEEWVFFMVFFILMGKLVIRAVLYIPVKGLPEQSWFYNLGTIFLLVCLLTLFINKKNRWVKRITYLLTFLLFFFRELLKNVFSKDISSDILMVMYETTVRETNEFFSEYLLSSGTLFTLSLTLLIALLVYFLEKRKYKITQFLHHFYKKDYLSPLIAILFIWGIVASFSYLRMMQCKSLDELSLWELSESQYSDPFTRLASSAFGLHLATTDMQQFIRLTEQSSHQAIAVDNTDSLNIIVVIGESYIKWHSSLYGYSLNTCPYQKEQADSGRLHVFNSVYTCSNYTSTAIKNILSPNSTARGERWNDFPFLPALMKRAGYDVYMWDNQRDQSSSTAFTFSLNSFLYHPAIQQISYTKVNDYPFQYDMDLVNDFSDKVKLKNSRNLIIFHLKGQHFEASERYPANQYKKFKAEDVPNVATFLTEDKRHEIAEYDNATYYNDQVLRRIMELYHNEPTIVISFSDHGEEIYDYRDSKGRVDALEDTEEMVQRYQYQIPFTIWCSERYSASHPEQIAALECSVNKSWCTDNLSQLLFRFATVQTPYYQPSRDLLSEQYHAMSDTVTSIFNDSCFIAHAGGMIGNDTYTNSREALELAIAGGYKFIELDLSMTRDSVLVCSHGFEEFKNGYIPTVNEFLARRIANLYTPMTLVDAIRIWRKSSCILVTDKISDPQLLNKYFAKDERGKVYVETKSRKHYLSLAQEGYVPMFCLYDLNFLTFCYYMKLRYLNKLDIKRVVVHSSSDADYLRYIRRKHGVKVAMYTSNSQEFFLQHLGYDADMIYTDNWDVKNNRNYNKSNLLTY